MATTYSVRKLTNLEAPAGAKLFKIKKWEIAIYNGGISFAEEDGMRSYHATIYNDLTVGYDYLPPAPPKYVREFVQKTVIKMSKDPKSRKLLGLDRVAVKAY